MGLVLGPGEEVLAGWGWGWGSCTDGHTMNLFLHIVEKLHTRFSCYFWKSVLLLRLEDNVTWLPGSSSFKNWLHLDLSFKSTPYP